MLLEEIYRRAKVVNSGRALTTVNEFTDQLPALRPEVLIEVAQKIVRVMDLSVNKIVTEEDKGTALATTVSLLTGIPMAIARWYPYSLDGVNELWVDLKSEYFDGRLYLNGIDAGDRVAIIDDTLSTGGAVVALVEAVRAGGGEVFDVVCAVEKVGNNGSLNVKSKTGIEVKVIMKIAVDEEGVKVL
ncbi:adenine phosphoribosyltransferase [Pseudomonas sp. SDO528_S397]